MNRSETRLQAVRPSGQDFLEKPSLALLLSAQDEQFALCRELEDIADSLPASVNRQKCLYAAKAILTLIKTAHAYEEDIFFRWLLKVPDHDESLPVTLERLKIEHCEDECYAEELADVLLRLGRGDQVNMEATGYMLRGFFEARRRHIAFERDHLMRHIRL